MKLYHAITCGTLAALLTSPALMAQTVAPVPATPPNGPRPNGPPPMIAFDEATAKDYLARIDEGRNALSLQMGLFMRPRPSLEAEQAVELINQQIAKETPGSRRWALLQNLVGFGGFRAPGLNSEANTAYKALFSAPATPEAAPVVEGALRNYLSSVASTGMGRGDSSSTPDVMLAALNAYFSLPFTTTPTTVPVPAPGAPRPLPTQALKWGDAAQNTGSTAALAKEIETRLKDPALTGAARLRVLSVGAELNEGLDAERAVELIEEASPLAAQFAPEDTNFTALQVRLLAANGKIPAAIAAQKASIARTGKGRAQLLSLQARTGDGTGLKATVEELKRPDADKEEIQAAMVALARLTDVEGVNGPQLAREVGENYLNAPRTRTAEEEISMKMSLARLIYRSGDKEAAIKLLQTIPAPANDADAMTLRQYRGIDNMIKQMQDGKYY